MSKKIKLFLFIGLPCSFLLTSCNVDMIQHRIETVVNNMLPNLYITLMQLGLFALTAVVFIFLAYKPLKKKLQKRAEFIQSNIDDSKKKKEEAEINLQKANDIVFASQKKASLIIQEAQVMAEQKAQSLEIELSKHIEDQKQQAHKDIEAERVKMKKEAKIEMVDAVLTTSKEVLKREVTKEDNDRFIEEFIDELDKK